MGATKVETTDPRWNRALYFSLGLLVASAAFGIKLVFFDRAEGTLVDRAGETRNATTGWDVRVDPDSGRLSLRHGESRFEPPWTMKPGWFVFMENSARAWTFNGDDQLILFVAGTGPFGPDDAPQPVPIAVSRRIGDQHIRQLAEIAAQTKRRLGLTPGPAP